MTVWVVHPVTQDISAAAQYGEIKYITDRYVYPDELEKRDTDEWLPTLVLEKLRWTALHFDDPGRHYLLIVGDQLLLAQAIAYLARSGSFDVLRYDREAKGYYPVRIEGR